MQRRAGSGIRERDSFVDLDVAFVGSLQPPRDRTPFEVVVVLANGQPVQSSDPSIHRARSKAAERRSGRWSGKPRPNSGASSWSELVERRSEPVERRSKTGATRGAAE